MGWAGNCGRTNNINSMSAWESIDVCPDIVNSSLKYAPRTRRIPERESEWTIRYLAQVRYLTFVK